MLGFITKIDQSNCADPQMLAYEIRKALTQFKIVHVSSFAGNSTERKNFYDKLTDAIGPCQTESEDGRTNTKIPGKWLEVRYDPNINNAYRHSNNAQPLHTDYAYVGSSPTLTLMFCEAQSVAGGQTVFIDGEQLLSLLRIQNPVLLDRLLSTKVRFSKYWTNTHDERTAYILELCEDTKLVKVNWNYYCVNKNESFAMRQLAEDFHHYLSTHIMGSSHLSEIILNPGEAVIWQDELILHGRYGFKANQLGDRSLWKTGIYWYGSV